MRFVPEKLERMLVPGGKFQQLGKLERRFMRPTDHPNQAIGTMFANDKGIVTGIVSV